MSAPVLPTSHNPEDPAVQACAAHNRALKDELWAKAAA
jgi:3-methylcrotonyl-CoA carboxylase beta subunit